MSESPHTTDRPITRRRFVQGSALAGFATFLAACGRAGTSAAPSTAASVAPSAAASGGASAAPSASAAPTPKPTMAAELNWANWTYYMDVDEATGKFPTLEQFTAEYGTKVNYKEVIDDNDTFIGTITPQLKAGQDTGWDLIVVTDWLAAKIISLGWAEKIDQSSVPNCVANLADGLKGYPWDPNMDYHYPWQSGMTGVGYNVKTLTENNIAEPTKIADLWAIPAEKLTFLSEARDTFGLALLKLGIDPNPETVTDDDLQKVADDIQPLVDKGLRFTGNEYLQDFAQKKVWAAFVWSGDLASSGGEDDRFIVPEEGALIWTDNMLIPKGAANKYTAELMMNFVYDPKVAAQIAAYVYYVSPVKGAAEEIKALDDTAASNPLLFPDAATVAKQHSFQALSEDQEKTMNELYATLSGL